MASLKERLAERADGAEPSGLGWLFILLFLILLSAAVLYFSQGGKNLIGSLPTPTNTIASRPSRTYSVYYDRGVFSPTNLRIHAGDTVRFENDNTLPIRVVTDPHPAHNGLVGFDSASEIRNKESFTYIFNAVGIFSYHNERNPNETGTIIVR